MDEDREQKVADIKQRIEQDEYRVDAGAVADAILRRWRALGRVVTERFESQNECSYPDRPAGASVNVTPGDPPSTRPIHVSGGPPALRWPLGGIQTQSS
jgi:Anti-sigma-28 factor, FlgM